MFTKKQIILILFIIVFLVWMAVFENSRTNLLEVKFFDVGQGDSILIETPNKQQILIDGGPDNTVLEKLGEALPFYDRYIDIVILTHPDEDHITGLIEVLENFEIGYILVSGIKKNTATYKEWEERLDKSNAVLKIAKAGQTIELDENIYLKILWPDASLKKDFLEDINDNSIVAQLVYGDSEFLFTGDIGKEVEGELILKNNLNSDVLKVAHHGSKNSSSYVFIKEVNPNFAVFSVGADNRYGHPHNEILQRLNNSSIFRIDVAGDIKMISNGLKIEVVNVN